MSTNPNTPKSGNWTVSDLREWILDEKTTGADIRRLSRGLTSEMVAAVAKLMSNLDLIYAAQKIRITAHCNTTIGLPGTSPAACSPTTQPTTQMEFWPPPWRASPSELATPSLASTPSPILPNG